MNINFDWNAFRCNKIGVRCKNENEAKDFVLKCFDHNLKWYNETSNLNKKFFYNCIYIYEDNLCVCYDDYYKQNDYSILEWGDFMNNIHKEFTKQDLKTGMIVELRNGNICVKLGGYSLVVINKDATNNSYLLTNYNDDLTYKYGKTKDNDVFKIYVIKDYNCMSLSIDKIIDTKNLTLIWERKEESREMTVEEIEKALGYSVKIVK